MQLPKFVSDSQALSLLQDKWKSILDPLLGQPLNNSNFLTGVAIATGKNVINHGLNRIQQGWILADINSAADLYRSDSFNSKTLTLTSSAPCTVSLVVF